MDNQSDSDVRCKTIDDIAIIGAGIAGSYAAWRFRQAGMTISLYEYSNRIGGRCHTVKFPGIPDINVELGAMRFRAQDVLLNRTITELGLKITDFSPHSTSDTLYYLRGQHLRHNDLPKASFYNLKPGDRKEIDQLKWEVFKNYTNVDSSVEGYNKAPKKLYHETPDGIPLYKQSRETLHAKYLTPELDIFIRDAGGYFSNYKANAAAFVPRADPALPSTSSPEKAVASGFQSVPETLVQRFLDSSSKHSFHPNKHLRKIVKHKEGHYILYFQPTRTDRGVTKDTGDPHEIVFARKVLLAVPKMALEHLDWDGLKEPVTVDYIKNSLHVTQASKMFFAYDDAWWRNTLQTAPHIISTTALKNTRDFGVSPSTGRAVLNTSYTDIDSPMWRDAVQQGQSIPGVGDDSLAFTDIALNIANKTLSEIFDIPVKEVPKPNHAVIRIWDEYPFGASWYSFKPGYIWEDVESHMTKPSANDDVFIISNTFSGKSQTGWVEGALEIVETLLDKYFPNIN